MSFTYLQAFDKLAASKVDSMQKIAADTVGPKLEQVTYHDGSYSLIERIRWSLLGEKRLIEFVKRVK